MRLRVYYVVMIISIVIINAKLSYKMNCDSLLSHIHQFVQLNEEEIAALKAVLISRPFRQGDMMVRSGDTAGYLMYVCSGYILTYITDDDGTERVVQIATEGWWAPDLFSLTNQAKTTYSTRGLCNGEVLLFPKLAQNYLLEKFIKFERYFRIIFQESLIRQQSRFIETFSTPAGERYLAYVARFPGIEQFVPQKYIASYLGITPQFLSKIRKKQSRRSVNIG